jgi:glycosyltransferase involved in cell wall biosynthesis
LRILAWPRRLESNPIFGAINDRLQAVHGTVVEDFTSRRLLSGRHDVWHVQFPETVLYHRSVWKALPRTLVLRLLVEFARWRGIKLVWTANNLGSHEGNHPRLERWLWRFFLGRVDGFVAHSETGVAAIRDYHPVLRDKRCFIVPEPHFRSVRHAGVDRAAARARLGLPAGCRAVLFVGRIRPYKCVDRLIDAFRGCPGADLRLVVAGRPYTPELAQGLRARAAGDERIELVFEHIPERELQVYFNGCDLVALPYRHILLSGTALLALSYDRPILVPKLGALAELAAEMGPDWVRLYEGTLEAADLGAALEWAAAPRAAAPDLGRHGLDSVAGALQRAYDSVTA